MQTCGHNGQDDPGEYAMQLVSASILPMVLKAAIELGVFDVIDKAGSGAQLSPSQIAAQIAPGNKPEAPLVLEQILRLLASHSILTYSVSDDQIHRVVYGLAPVAKYFVQNQQEGSEGSLRLMLNIVQDKVILNTWYHLKDAVLEGGNLFNRAYEMTPTEYIQRNDPGFGELLMSSLREFNPIFTRKMLERYTGFEGLNSLVDVGGGDGSILNMIVSKYPNIKGINFDLVAVIEKSPSYPGTVSIFTSCVMMIDKHLLVIKLDKSWNVIVKYYTLLLTFDDLLQVLSMWQGICLLTFQMEKFIIHQFDDERCLKILKNCYEAIPINGKVIVVDMLVPDAPETSLAGKSLFQYEFLMMNTNTGGKEKTRREFESLAKEAGFSHIQVPCSAYNFSVVEFYKSF
ncbi:hypothetical protein EZV62_002829 [Acer yangbiense]|uniref:O-methyltransferase domain-containing protein n=1 Tax=Acer yangbiense TaxID=1000413 RepID=A0A5C7IYE1_9ROSI|nr:hypothetical protein EZV62_002829 [Acer yangbiense]